MKQKIFTCDLCGADITSAHKKYKFKKYEHSYCNHDMPEWAKWNRYDMCESCLFDLLAFIKEKRRDKNG